MISSCRNNSGNGRLFAAWMILSGLFIALLVLLPLLSLLIYADPVRQLALLRSPEIIAALRVTLITSTLATLGIIITGLPTSFAISRFSRKSRAAIDTLLELPMVLPQIVAGIALLLAFGRNGIFGRFLQTWGWQIPFSMAAVIMTIIFVLAPFFIRRVTILFDQVDRELEEAAQLLGGRAFFTFCHITLPLCRRSLLAEAIMVFLQSIGLFGAIILFAGNIPGRTRTLTLAIFDAFESNPEVAFALAALLLLISALLLLAGRLLMRNLGDTA